MADVKVSGLPPDTSLDGNHYTVLNDPTGPTTKRTLLSTLAAWFFDQLNIPTATGSPVSRAIDMGKNFIVSGLAWSADAVASTRNASMTSGVVYIAGKKLTAAAVSARAFTASKDTYVDAKDNGDGTALLIYTEVANNAASPSTLQNGDTFSQLTHVRVGIIVTGATNIAATTSIAQGGFANILPVINAQTLRGNDTLGNIIYPKGPVTPALTQSPYKFELRRDAALNTPVAFAAVQFDAKNFDTGNNCDVTTNKGRFTAPVAGYYAFTGAVLAAYQTGDHMYMGIMKNGAEYRRFIEITQGSASNFTNGVAGFIQLAAGDYVELGMSAPLARAILVGTGGAYCWFSGYLQSAS